MIKQLRIRVLPQVWRDQQKLEQQICRDNAISPKGLRGIRIIHQSIDARQRQVMIQLDVDAYINEEPPTDAFTAVTYRELPAGAPTVVVVGAGPGGLFASLRLIERGVKPILIERGHDVTERRRDVANITREQRVNPESNFCFGEGGAGAFSDGKLFTRSKKRGNVQQVLEGLCQFGADTDILSAAHPHIGTDRLPAIISRIRDKIIECGGEVHFGTAVTGLIIENSKVKGVHTADGAEYHGPVILATGHSARDVYRMLERQGVRIEAKGLAIGCRLEHPQELIDQIQYHSPQGRGKWLPAAEYSFVTQATGIANGGGDGVSRGVYSFCMCPGGVIVPSATDNDQVVVNGMSASARGSRWANSAMVTEIRPEDLAFFGIEQGPLAMMSLQEQIEHAAWIAGGKLQVAPAQRMTDFVSSKASSSLSSSSYTPGITSSPMHEWMPQFIVSRMQQALKYFGQRARGFLTQEATLVGVETRTSSPVRIPRDPETLSHPEVQGLYPCGEGAGFAGGIVSAAMDGIKIADAILLAKHTL